MDGIVLQLRALLYYQNRLKKNEYLSDDARALMKKEKLRNLVSYAKSHSGFYGKLFKSINPDNFSLADLPVINKEIFMANFDKIVTDKALKRGEIEDYLGAENPPYMYKGRYHVHTTTGTSGISTIMAHNPREWFTIVSGMMRWSSFSKAPTFRIPRVRVASFVTKDKFYNSYRLNRSFRLFLLNNRIYNIADSQDEHIEELNRFQPEILVASAALTACFARAQIEGQLRIKPSFISTAMETKTDEIKALIREAWGIDSFEIYDMAEMLCLSSDCPYHTGLHVYEDFGLLEIVDRNNAPVQPGEWGEKILVTNLYNYTQPVIRYEIHDSVAWAGTPCPCGRTLPLIKGVRGRTENIVTFKTVRGGEIKLWSQHFIDLNRLLKPLREFKIFKKKDDILVLFTASTNEDSFRGVFRKEFEKLIALYDLFVANIEYRLVRQIPRSRSGKFTQIVDVKDFPRI